jgi:Flp pilus assembly protein TadG
MSNINPITALVLMKHFSELADAADQGASAQAEVSDYDRGRASAFRTAALAVATVCDDSKPAEEPSAELDYVVL